MGDQGTNALAALDLRTNPASYPRRLVKLLVGVVPLVALAVVTKPAEPGR